MQTTTTTPTTPATLLNLFAPTPTLAELADVEAGRYEALETEAAGLFARTMRELAFKIRLTEADTVADYEARLEVLDDGIRAEWEAIGYEAGRAAGCVHLDAFD